jgi:CRP-like cAMP-binding protein
VTAVETALERHLSTKIMRAGKPRIAKVGKGSVLVRQGEPGVELFLLLDGMVQIDVDDTPLAEVGPGAILGERAILEGGRRTSTVRALTNCTVAVASAEQIDHTSLAELSTGHHREHTGKRSQPAAPGDSPRP